LERRVEGRDEKFTKDISGTRRTPCSEKITSNGNPSTASDQSKGRLLREKKEGKKAVGKKGGQ